MSPDSTPGDLHDSRGNEPVPGQPGSPDVWATPPPRPDDHDPSPLPNTEGWDRPPDVVAGDPLGPLPSTFGRYRILKRLGDGGMGTVYLARDTQLDRLVALKVPKLGKDDAKARERFLREARAAATVHHPNLCPVHDAGEVDGMLFLTMAYVEGHTLTKALHGTRPTDRQAAALVRKLALALAEAHARKVIHRDLKPGNVMLDARGEPVVMDFGLARRGGRTDPSLTQFGTVLGTPAYMAPEQAEGDPDEVGPSCDIYSLGVILYQLLAGGVPFKGDRLAILSQLATREPAPPSARRPGLDPSLEAICLKAMAKRPERRYPTMAEFAAALTDFLKTGSPSSSGETAVIETPARQGPPKHRRRRRKGLVPAWVYVAAVVVVLGWLGNLALRRDQRADPEPPAPAPVVKPIVKAAPPPPPPPPDDKEKRLKEAEAALAKARAHLEKQEYREAIAEAGKAVGLAPDLAGTRRTRGLALAAAGKAKEAVADLTAALTKDGEDVLALQARAGLLVELKDNFAAIEDYTALLRLRPRDARSYLARARLHEPNGPAGKANAKRDYASAVAIDPELARQVPKDSVPRLEWDDQKLRLGLIRAPDLAGEAEWFREDFRNPKYRLANQPGQAYRDGKYVVNVMSKGRLASEIPVKIPKAGGANGDFACTLAGRLVGIGCNWGLQVKQGSELEFEIKLNANGLLSLATKGGGTPTKLEPVPGAHPGIKRSPPPPKARTKAKPRPKIGEINTMLVVVRGRYLEVSVNDYVVCQPVVLEREIKAPSLFLTVWARNTQGATGEFFEVKVQSVTKLPPLANRVPSLNR